MSQYQDKPSILSFLLPFLIFICVGVIIVLGFQLWKSLQPGASDSEAFLYIDRGKAKILPWSLQEWENGFNGSRILQGDSIKISNTGRAVLKLFDGSAIRLGPQTEVLVQELSQNGENYNVKIILQNGSLWTLIEERRKGYANFKVRTGHLNIIAKGTTLAVETRPTETVRLIKGDVEVEVIVKSGNIEKIVERMQLAEGKEISVGPAELTAYENFKSPEVITDISAEFLSSSWYEWNTKEDQSPTDYNRAPLPLEDLERSATPSASTLEASIMETEEEEFLGAPSITSPADSILSTDKEDVKIRGNAPGKTAKIIVVTSENGVRDEYVLKNFTPGDSSWTYTAAVQYGNLQPGKNTFTIYAEFPDGSRSSPAQLTIIYQKKEQEASPDA